MAHADVLPHRHLVAHEVLEDDAHFAMQVLDGVLAQIDAVEQDLAFGGVVEARDQLDHGGLALAVFADQGDALAGLDGEVEVLQHAALGAGIGEGDVAEFEAAADGPGRGQGVRLALHRGLACRRTRSDR